MTGIATVQSVTGACCHWLKTQSQSQAAEYEENHNFIPDFTFVCLLFYFLFSDLQVKRETLSAVMTYLKKQTLILELNVTIMKLELRVDEVTLYLIQLGTVLISKRPRGFIRGRSLFQNQKSF